MGGMTRLLLLLWVGVTASTVVDLQKRIIGGRDCGPAERPYHVKLIGHNRTHETLCGGSLISDQWILTAAHCWEPGWTLTAYLGGHPILSNARLMQITEHRIHTDTQNRSHDIMLLQLPSTTTIQPVPLPNCGPPNPLNIGDTVEVAGYASMTMGPNNQREHDRAPVLQCVNITVIDDQPLRNCLIWTSPRLYQNWKSYQSPGVDTSPGDSGGGVVFNGMIYGVHVFGTNATHACVAPKGFMDVCAYKGWILNTTGIADPTPRPGPGPGPRPGPGPVSAPVKRPKLPAGLAP